MGKLINLLMILKKQLDYFFRTTPVAPPFPDQLQTATENHHYPPEAPERPISASSSDHTF